MVRGLLLVAAATAILLSGIVPAVAQITSVSPGSAHVKPGNSVGVTVTTDAGSVVLASGSAPGVSVGQSGFTFTFTAFTTATPGTYGYTFTDGASTGSFTLIVDEPPATTTTTTVPPTTTTTRPPVATTTTRPATTTTRPTTTTTAPTTTTSTTSTTTTTLAPTTTTTTTSTTTTVPPTTTTSTLVPAAIVAIDDGDEGGSSFGNPFVWFGGGAALFALALAGAYVLWSRRRPTYGAATPGFVLAWRQRRERRKVSKPSQGSKTAGLSYWWRTSGPVASYHDWRESHHAAKTVRQQIKDRQRLRRQGD